MHDSMASAITLLLGAVPPPPPEVQRADSHCTLWTWLLALSLEFTVHNSALK